MELVLSRDFDRDHVKMASNLEKNYLVVALTDHSEQFENLSNELLCTVMTGELNFETVSVI